jgi:hypothetical protein
MRTQPKGNEMTEFHTSPTTLTEMKGVIMAELDSILSEHNYPITLENQYTLMLATRESWQEDTDDSLSKSMYMLALTLLISEVQVKLLTQHPANK